MISGWECKEPGIQAEYEPLKDPAHAAGPIQVIAMDRKGT